MNPERITLDRVMQYTGMHNLLLSLWLWVSRSAAICKLCYLLSFGLCFTDLQKTLVF